MAVVDETVRIRNWLFTVNYSYIQLLVNFLLLQPHTLLLSL